MLKLQLSIFLVSIIYSVFTQSMSNHPLVYVSHSDKKGYIDLSGNEIIPVEFDDVKRFSEGLIALNIGAKEINYELVGGKWGYWNFNGTKVIDLLYDDAKQFNDGLAPVKKRDFYGYINARNETIIDFKFEDAESFFDGYAAVKENGKWGLIDKNGNYFIKESFDGIEKYSPDLFIVFHKQGEFVEYEDGFSFKEVFGKYGLIDTSGKLILDTIYDYINDLSNGLARIEKDNKYGFIDTKGEIVIPICYDIADDFSEGYAAVGKYDDVKWDFNYGYIDVKGNLLIDYNFQNAEQFVNGVAKVRYGPQRMISYTIVNKRNGKKSTYPNNKLHGINLIDKKGSDLLNEHKDIINRYGDSLYIIYSNEGAGAYDESLNVLISPKYSNLSYVGNGLYMAKLSGSNDKIIINSNEERIFKNLKIWKIEHLVNDLYVVSIIEKKVKSKTFTKSGIISKNEEWVLKPKYDFIYNRIIEQK